MKKGVTFIDWSVSAGLFILYLVTIFVLLGPVFKQDVSTDHLTNIIKNGIEENLTLELKRIPVFIKINTSEEVSGSGGKDDDPNGDPFGPQYSSHNVNVKIKLKNLPIELEGINNDRMFTIYGKNSEIKNKNLDYAGDNLDLITNMKNLGLQTDTDVKTTEISIYASPETIFKDFDVNPGSFWPTNNTFGVSESLTGIYKPWFVQFTNNSYDDAKDIFNYPKEKNFIIEIYNLTNINETPILNFTKSTPELRDEVDVIMWPYWLIANDSTVIRYPITLLVKIW